MDTWAVRPADTTVERLLADVEAIARDADGLTVTGGEPFDQPDALGALLRGWRALGGGDVLVFSGHPLATLEPHLGGMRGLIDCLVADPFRAEAGQTLALRGSDNQRLVCLTELGRRRFESFQRRLTETDRALDVLFDDATGEVFMAGIPQPGDLRRLSALLGREGHEVTVSEDRRGTAC